MKHKESDLQIRCVTWFRYQYPAFARLLEHPKNEGTGDRRRGAIAKAEGVQPGVADLILHLPAYNGTDGTYTSLAIEMKTPSGRQSPEQKQWQRYFEAAGGKYVICRAYDDFLSEVANYMLHVPMSVQTEIKAAYSEFCNTEEESTKQKLRKIFKK